MQAGCFPPKFPQPEARPLGDPGPARHSTAFHPVQMSRHSTRQTSSQTCCPPPGPGGQPAMLLASVPMGPGHWDLHTLLLPRTLQLVKQPHRHTPGTRPCPLPSSPDGDQTGQTQAFLGLPQTLPPGPRTCQVSESRPSCASECMYENTHICMCMCMCACVCMLILAIAVSYITSHTPKCPPQPPALAPPNRAETNHLAVATAPCPGEPLSLCPPLGGAQRTGPQGAQV